MSGMADGIRVAAVVALVGALAALVALPARRTGGVATLHLPVTSELAA